MGTNLQVLPDQPHTELTVEMAAIAGLLRDIGLMEQKIASFGEIRFRNAFNFLQDPAFIIRTIRPGR